MPARVLSLILAALGLAQAALFNYHEQVGVGGTLCVVNRDFCLSRDYVPRDLVHPAVSCTVPGLRLRSEAADTLAKLFGAAHDEAGYELVAISGWRSFGRQAAIMSRRKENAGESHAKRYVALPGASEHQLGLAVDIGKVGGNGLMPHFGKTKEGQWVAENAQRFGFILRYLPQYTPVTGIAYEPWHLRYVGVEHAKAIKALDVPLETYVDALKTMRRENGRQEGKTP